MLRGQYGTATPSSLVPVSHREDAQPNEGLRKQSRKLPPSIRSTTTAPPGVTTTYYRGYRGKEIYPDGRMGQERSQHGPQLQYATRGNPAWRGRGHSGLSRGSHPHWNAGHVIASSSNDGHSTLASSSNRKTSGVHVRASLPYDNTDPGPSQRRTYSTAFAGPSYPSAAPPAMDSSQDTWWKNRSRSPTPKLPPVPLKRRKMDGQPETPPQATISRLPLPGRLPKTVESIKQGSNAQQGHTIMQELIVKPEPIVKQEPTVKQEPLSPSPPPHSIPPERKLITESCQFYHFPESCKKSDPNHRQNRRSFFLEKYRELVNLGLRKTKAFSRDDGLVIEWTSSIPVWSDTLQPEVVNLATVIQRAYKINTSLTKSSASVRRKRRAASLRSDVSPGPSQSQPQDLTPAKNLPASTKAISLPVSVATIPRTTKLMAVNSQSTTVAVAEISPRHTEVVNAPRSVPPIPRRRLPLPGRKYAEPKPTTVPVAFAPRRSATPSSITAPASTYSNIMKSVNPINLPSLESTPSLVKHNLPGTSPGSFPSDPTYPESQDSVHRKQNSPSDDKISGRAHTPPDFATATTVLPPSVSTIGDPGAAITQTPKDEEHQAEVEDECAETEDVAIDLLTPTSNDMGLGDEADIDDFTDDDGANEIEGLVAAFLQRYCQLFDSDRSKLAAAYDKDALFSYYVHHLDSERSSSKTASLFAPEVNSVFGHSSSQASASPVSRGRIEIKARLLSIGRYQFCPRGVTGNLIYDVVDCPAGILLTVHGEVINPHTSNPLMDHVLTLDQSFVLRKWDVDVHENDNAGTDSSPEHSRDSDWPLVALSHQMTVRAAPLLSTERLEDSAPWIRGITQG